ncbi:sulfatase-like hydrolase/transferase, partial [bacterium]|nr:sulfatase-like hydrolase/transferase [bacterium]
PAPSVVLVTIDTLRPDHLGVYGHPGARTPHLDALARRGALFTDARVPYPLTLPSHASLLTGRLPYRHGARRNDSFEFDRSLPTLPGRFAAEGCATGAVVSTFVLNRNFGLAEDFGTYRDLDDATDPRRGRNERHARETASLATEWLDARADSSVFLWTHFFDPHDDYTPPAPWIGLYRGEEVDLYDGEIAYTDVHFGRLLRALEDRGDAADLLLVVTSDHGEAFGEHREVGHGFFLYDTTLRVPLLFARPGARRAAAPRIHRTPVRSIDVFPTICAETGLAIESEADGIALDPFGNGPAESPPLYLETFEPTVGYGATDLRGIAWEDRKWIEAPRPELYDLREDPHELDNRAGTEDAREAELRDLLDDHLAAERLAEEERAASGDGAGEVDDETRARLLALGYVTAGADEEAATAWSRRDPKDIVHLIPRMYAGIRACRERRMDEGLAILSSVLEEDPLNSKALHWVSEGRLAAGDSVGAMDVYRTALEHDPRNVELLNRLGILSLKMHRPQEAIDALGVVVELDPHSVAGWLNLASAHMMARHPRKAREAVAEALRVDPANVSAKRMAERLGMTPQSR